MSDGNITNRAPVAPVPNPGAPEPTPGIPPAPGTEPLSPRLAALMRKEAQAVGKLREAKAIEEQAKKDRAAWESERAQYGEFDRRWRENPLDALRSRGVSIDDLARIAGNQGQMTPELQLRSQLQQQADHIKSLETKLDERFGKYDESEKARAEQEVKASEEALQSDIRQLVDGAGDKFQLTKMFARHDLVYSIIDTHFQKTNEILEIDKAAEQAEKMLLDEALKLQPVLDKHRQPPAPGTTGAPQGSLRETARMLAGQEQRWVERAPKTLSNDLPQSAPSAPRRVLTDQERMANALAKLRAARS
jgi:hypothetical protein